MFEGKKILITGGTGSLGQALTKRLLTLDVDTIRIFSRNENKQVEMESKFNDDRIRFLLGDVRDYERLLMAVEGIAGVPPLNPQSRMSGRTVGSNAPCVATW